MQKPKSMMICYYGERIYLDEAYVGGAGNGIKEDIRYHLLKQNVIFAKQGCTSF